MKETFPSFLMVCSGNTCRSPMAAALMRAVLDEKGLTGWPVESAGTAAVEGQPAADHAVQVLAEQGVSLRGHTSRQAASLPLEEYDLILVMEPRHKLALLELTPHLAERIFTLGQIAGTGEPVWDPFGGTVEDYRTTAQQIERLLRAGLDKIIGLVEAGKLAE